MGEQIHRQEADEQQESIDRKVKQIAETNEQIKAYEREYNTQEKRKKQIETSKTWKLGQLVKRLRHMWNKVTNGSMNEKETIDHLETEVLEQREQIEQLESELARLRLLDDQLTNFTITQQIRTLQEDGELLKQLEQIITQKNKLQTNYREALLYAARLYMNEDEATKKVIYERILSGLSIEEIPEFMIRAGLTDTPISLRHAASFRGSLSMRMRQQQLAGTLPEWHLDDKQTAYDFVSAFNIIVPKLDKNIYTVDTIPQREEVVIKPIDAAGARGVYLIHEPNYIFDVRHANVLTSFTELQAAMHRDITSGAVEEDAWLMEQLIYEFKKQRLPARDLKFYSFYGKVGLILEIVRDPEIRHTWWTRDGKRISTGKYEATLFAGQGVTETEIEQVERLSSAIPAPFMRIDFLKSESGLVFGEFTPKPGNYDDFDQAIDAWLGDYFVQAEGRLVEDLLNGKTFPEYNEFIQSLADKEVGLRLTRRRKYSGWDKQNMVTTSNRRNRLRNRK